MHHYKNSRFGEFEQEQQIKRVGFWRKSSPRFKWFQHKHISDTYVETAVSTGHWIVYLLGLICYVWFQMGSPSSYFYQTASWDSWIRISKLLWLNHGTKESSGLSGQKKITHFAGSTEFFLLIVKYLIKWKSISILLQKLKNRLFISKICKMLKISFYVTHTLSQKNP